MILEDLEYIFKAQVAEGTTNLYFMLIDSDGYKVVERHQLADIESLVPMLSSFQYVGHDGRIPRFQK